MKLKIRGFSINSVIYFLYFLYFIMFFNFIFCSNPIQLLSFPKTNLSYSLFRSLLIQFYKQNRLYKTSLYFIGRLFKITHGLSKRQLSSTTMYTLIHILHNNFNSGDTPWLNTLIRKIRVYIQQKCTTATEKILLHKLGRLWHSVAIN